VKINLRKIINDPEVADELANEIETALIDTVKQAVTPPLPFEVGKTYLIRTITMIDVGRVTKIVGNFLIMDDASWIADTGRWFDCLRRTDVFIEVEPFAHPLIINTQSIIDATLWPYQLPTEAK
jgi:hypothetical protein